MLSANAIIEALSFSILGSKSVSRHTLLPLPAPPTVAMVTGRGDGATSGGEMRNMLQSLSADEDES